MSSSPESIYVEFANNLHLSKKENLIYFRFELTIFEQSRRMNHVQCLGAPLGVKRLDRTNADVGVIANVEQQKTQVFLFSYCCPLMLKWVVCPICDECPPGYIADETVEESGCFTCSCIPIETDRPCAVLGCPPGCETLGQDENGCGGYCECGTTEEPGNNFFMEHACNDCIMW